MSSIRGKYAKAACGLLHKLREAGIKAGPVAQPSKRDPTIVVYGMTVAGIKKLPKEHDGFKVEGTTKSFNYDRGQLIDLVQVSQR